MLESQPLFFARVGSLAPMFETAAAGGGGVFVLALTSNPEGAQVQRAVAADGRTVAQTVIAPIKRQEPGHYAFYQLSARGLWSQLAAWQRWLVRRMRSFSFAPVGANDAAQKADFGDLMRTLGIDREAEEFAGQISRVERDLLWAHRRGLSIPPYVAAAFREAVELAQARRAA